MIIVGAVIMVIGLIGIVVRAFPPVHSTHRRIYILANRFTMGVDCQLPAKSRLDERTRGELEWQRARIVRNPSL
jgi:hypothetical protein